MRDWSVEIIRAGDENAMPFDDLDLNERVSDLVLQYQDRGLAFSHRPDRYTMRFIVEALNPSDAIQEAMDVVYKAADQFDLPQWPVLKTTATEWEEFERELEQPTYPPVLGVAELADRLGVSRQRASQIARTDNFPKPYAELASGPVWFDPNVRRFVNQWDRKPGRPRKRVV